jgi:hypothetical protein
MVTIIELTAILSAVAGFLVAIFAVIQLLHMEKHRNIEISMKLFEWAESDRLRKAFRWVEEEFTFEGEPHRTKDKTSFEESDYPYEVTGFFEQVGFLVEKRFVDLDVVDDRLGSYIIADWKKLESWIMAHRKEKGDESFGEHFQKLYAKTTRYMKKR